MKMKSEGELVTFYSENRRIFGNLHLPNERAPCVIALHGLESSKDSGKWPFVASRLCDEGFACLRFSFGGCGEGSEKSEGEFEEVTLTGRIKNYRAAIKFLCSTNKVDIKRLGVVGSSFGGMVAIAAQEERIKAMVTLATPCKMPRIIGEEGGYCVLPSGRRFKMNFYENLKNYDLLRAVRNAPPILILQGSLDEVVPLEHAYKLYEAAGKPKKLEIIEGPDHVFSQIEHLNRVIDLSLGWFKKYL